MILRKIPHLMLRQKILNLASDLKFSFEGGYKTKSNTTGILYQSSKRNTRTLPYDSTRYSSFIDTEFCSKSIENTIQNAHLDSSNISETSKYLFSSVSLPENEKSDQDMSEESGRMTNIPNLFLASPKVPSKSKYILTNKKEPLDDFEKEASLHHTKTNYL
ncbi:hypothetical protein AVEN_14358-1 [Araneus ventricosus]|uniref:Uncharacterized protein n=1 Tax=Araneus ventricosus TaxID=182803 RepID=A0A4Y2NET2_ARAVE|nr:hypothetical protein AVEN_14358-1 [Araneus ventricosus]